MHFSVSGHVTLGVVRWRHELDYICPLWVLSKSGPIEASRCRVMANWFFPSNGLKRYFNGPLTAPFVWNLDSYVKDTTHMLNILDFFRFRDGDGQRSIFTMDIKSLYTVILVWTAPSHKTPFSNENGAVLLRIRLSTTLQRRKRSPKNGAIRKRTPERSDLKTMLFGNVVF